MRYQLGGEEFEIPTRHVWSTIPISILLRGMRPEAPADVLDAASQLAFRGMILIYLVLDQDRYSSTDAYYFPEESIPDFAPVRSPRFSAPQRSRAAKPYLCAELPSDPGLSGVGYERRGTGPAPLRLDAAGRPSQTRGVSRTVTRRLRQAYPVYHQGYEERFSKMDQWLGEIDGMLTFGRQGLFAHDNTHHTLAMAYAAVELPVSRWQIRPGALGGASQRIRNPRGGGLALVCVATTDPATPRLFL